MKRIAFKMMLFPGCKDEYKRRHDEIWPELKQLLKEAGISDYSIFLDEQSNTLFGVLKADDVERLNDLPGHPVMQRWWKQNIDIMETNPDYSPVQISLEEIFYMQ